MLGFVASDAVFVGLVAEVPCCDVVLEPVGFAVLAVDAGFVAGFCAVFCSTFVTLGDVGSCTGSDSGERKSRKVNANATTPTPMYNGVLFFFADEMGGYTVVIGAEGGVCIEAGLGVCGT